MKDRKNIEVLIATMDQKDHSLIKKMGIETDAIVGNQCNYNSVQKFVWNEHNIKYLNLAEKGVGLNRNNALMRSKGDICVLADDDMKFRHGYSDVVEYWFKKIPNADVIIFNLQEKEISRYIIKKPHRVLWFNYMRYGAARITFKKASIHENGIFFNLCYGGGAKYSHGEDTIFLAECLRKKLKIYAVPSYIACLEDTRESTWNKGFTDKYFRDQGKLFKIISPRWFKILCLQDSIRNRKRYNKFFLKAYKSMVKTSK